MGDSRLFLGGTHLNHIKSPNRLTAPWALCALAALTASCFGKPPGGKTGSCDPNPCNEADKGVGRTVCAVKGDAVTCGCNSEFYKEENDACVPLTTSTVKLGAPSSIDFSNRKATYTASFRVVDAAGNPIKNAAVAFADTLVKTGADGVAQVPQRFVYLPYKVRAVAHGFLDSLWTIRYGDCGAKQMELRLMPIERKVVLDSAVGGTLTHEAVTLQFPKDAFLKRDGSLHKGPTTVELSVATLNEGERAMPPEAAERLTSVTVAPIKLAAVVAVTLKDSVGAPLQLAAGRSVRMNLALPAIPGLTAGSTQRIFTRDDRSGLWNWENECTFKAASAELKAQGIDTVCSANLTHFSFTGVGGDGERTASLTTTQKTAYIVTAIARIKSIVTALELNARQANLEGRIGKFEFVSARATSARKLRLASEGTQVDFINAVAEMNESQAEREFRIIAMALKQAEALLQEAELYYDDVDFENRTTYLYNVGPIPDVVLGPSPDIFSGPPVIVLPSFECTKDTDCGTNDACKGGYCIQRWKKPCSILQDECSSSGKFSCSSDSTCEINPAYCANASTCGRGQSCVSNACVDDCVTVGCGTATPIQVCNATTRKCEAPAPTAVSCTTDADCPGEWCDCASKKCTALAQRGSFCTDKNACSPGAACSTCRCVQDCTLADALPCAAGTVCNKVTLACEAAPSCPMTCAAGSYCDTSSTLPYPRCELDCTHPQATSCQSSGMVCNDLNKKCDPLISTGQYACSKLDVTIADLPSRYTLARNEELPYGKCTAAERADAGGMCPLASVAPSDENLALGACHMLRVNSTASTWDGRLKVTFTDGNAVDGGTKTLFYSKQLTVPLSTDTMGSFVESQGSYCQANALTTCATPQTVCTQARCTAATVSLAWADVESLLVSDADGDGTFAPNPKVTGIPASLIDCNDSDAKVHPGAIELSCNDIDEDCDGTAVSPGAKWSSMPAATWNALCRTATCIAKETEVGGNGHDEDCDGIVSDLDGDKYAVAGDTSTFAGRLPGTDCDDTLSAVKPGAVEIPGNGRDDNCDGDADEDGFYSPSAWPITGVPAAKFTDCNDGDKRAFPGAPLDGGRREGGFASFYLFDADAGTTTRTAEFCTQFSGGRLHEASRAQLIKDINCDGFASDLDGDGWTVPGDNSLGAGKAYDCNDLDPRVFPTSTGANGKPSGCATSPALRNQSTCSPDLTEFGGGSRAVCPRLPDGNANQCVDLVDEKQVPWGIYVCSALSSRDPQGFVAGELFGPCDFGVKLPACKAGLQCSGPLDYSPAYLAQLLVQNPAWDVKSTFWKGACLPQCGDVCTDNPCKGAHKTQCTVVNRRPVCGCDPGYVANTAGVCVAL